MCNCDEMYACVSEIDDVLTPMSINKPIFILESTKKSLNLQQKKGGKNVSVRAQNQRQIQRPKKQKNK